MTTQEYQKLKEKNEQIKNQVARAEGAKEQALKQLQEEFGVKTLEEAEELLEKLEKEAATLKKEMADNMDALLKIIDWDSL
jgi:NTP pyrophosphatase (non-canonical NTP hydrolase)